MTGNKAYLDEFQDFNGGPVAFGGSRGYITGKGKIKTGKLDFEDVCFLKELQHFNLFSVSQMCDKKNKVLFTDSECLVLSPDENQVLLKIHRQNNMYSFNLENIVPSGGLTCLIAKATTDESNKWHLLSVLIHKHSLLHSNIIHQSSFDIPSLASLGHNDPGTLYTASGFLALANSNPLLCIYIYIYLLIHKKRGWFARVTYLDEFQDFNGGPVAFGGSRGYITGKGKIKIGKLDFEDVCFVKELQHFNFFSVSQMCDKKNK
ncbi:hypothetical protein Tco_0081570, partial [Tanacetum coccineum]